jgi:hypothetical protein
MGMPPCSGRRNRIVMERKPDESRRVYMSRKEVDDEINCCLEELKPYVKKEKPVDEGYYFFRNDFKLMSDVSCKFYKESLNSGKKLSKSKMNKIKKAYKRCKKTISKYEKAFLKVEGYKSFDKEMKETMKLIDNGIAESRMDRE